MTPFEKALDELLAPLNHLVCPCGAQLTTASTTIAEKWIEAHKHPLPPPKTPTA